MCSFSIPFLVYSVSNINYRRFRLLESQAGGATPSPAILKMDNLLDLDSNAAAAVVGDLLLGKLIEPRATRANKASSTQLQQAGGQERATSSSSPQDAQLPAPQIPLPSSITSAPAIIPEAIKVKRGGEGGGGSNALQIKSSHASWCILSRALAHFFLSRLCRAHIHADLLLFLS